MWLWMPRLIMQERDGSETSEGKLPRQALGFVNRANPSDTAATQLCAHTPALFFTSGCSQRARQLLAPHPTVFQTSMMRNCGVWL